MFRHLKITVIFAFATLFARPALAGFDNSGESKTAPEPTAITTLQPEVHEAKDQHQLGLRYLTGDGVPKDEATAFIWIRRAAEKGLLEAQSNLGLLYGKGYGVEQNVTQAVQWFRKAADQGSPEGQF